MAQTAAHLVDHVIPRVPVRQWVLSLPILLRLLLAAQPKLVTPMLQVVHRVITRHLLGQAGLKAAEAGRPTLRATWCLSSRQTGATAPRICSCRRWISCDAQGRWSQLRPRVCGADESGLMTRDNPRAAPEKDHFPLRSQRSADLSDPQRPTQARPAPCSGCHKEGKKRLKAENNILQAREPGADHGHVERLERMHG
jgi:hypothetical protein